MFFSFRFFFAVDTQLIIHVKNKQHTHNNEKGEEANTQFMLYALTHTLHLTLLVCALSFELIYLCYFMLLYTHLYTHFACAHKETKIRKKNHEKKATAEKKIIVMFKGLTY